MRDPLFLPLTFPEHMCVPEFALELGMESSDAGDSNFVVMFTFFLEMILDPQGVASMAPKGPKYPSPSFPQ